MKRGEINGISGTEFNTPQDSGVQIQPHLCGDPECRTLIIGIVDGAVNECGGGALDGKQIVTAALGPVEALALAHGILSLLSTYELELAAGVEFSDPESRTRQIITHTNSVLLPESILRKLMEETSL